jgi:hypothetical protein
VATALGDAGFLLPGSLNVRSYRCGKANCACHHADAKLHGPYIQWTRSLESKTVHRRLSQAQLEDFDEAKRVKDLLSRLEAVTVSMVERDPRWTQS